MCMRKEAGSGQVLKCSVGLTLHERRRAGVGKGRPDHRAARQPHPVGGVQSRPSPLGSPTGQDG